MKNTKETIEIDLEVYRALLGIKFAVDSMNDYCNHKDAETFAFMVVEAQERAVAYSKQVDELL